MKLAFYSYTLEKGQATKSFQCWLHKEETEDRMVAKDTLLPIICRKYCLFGGLGGGSGYYEGPGQHCLLH